MAQALVTGASGFIGKHLVKALLKHGDEVACLVRTSSQTGPLDEMGVRLVTGDISDPQSLAAAVAGVDVIYHLAGLNRALSYEQYCRINETGVKNLLVACANRTTPPVVVHLSSLSAAGPMQEPQLRIESDPPQPVSHYGSSKRAGEIVAQAMADKLPITVLRPPAVIGGGDKAGLAIFKGIRKLGIHPMLGLGKLVSLVHVDDLSAAMIAAFLRGKRISELESQNGNGAGSIHSGDGRGFYFVAAEEHPNYADLGRMVGRAVGRDKVLVMRVPRASIYGIAAWNELIGRVTRRPPYLDLDRVHEITGGHWICSSEKAHGELGFMPAASLQERLNQTADAYRADGWL